MGVCGLFLAAAAGCSVDDQGLASTGGAGGRGTGGASSSSSGSAGGAGGMGAGGAPECAAPSECPGTDTECRTRTCNGGQCGADNTPPGTALSQQTPGDCQEEQCDGMGGVTAANADGDVPDDGRECTIDSCTQGVPTYTYLADGAACAQNGGAHCNASGDCVECTTGAHCLSQICTAQQQCAAQACDDLVQNGNESDIDCGGMCPPCMTGQLCGGNTDCIGGLCAAGQCAPTCSDTIQNNAETDVDCGGPACGPCNVGQACLAATDCVTEKCGPAGTCQHSVVISEVRSRGLAGATDEFVELYNPASTAIVLDAQWKIEGRGSTAANYTTRWTGSGATLAPHGHYLIKGAAYTQMPAGDASLSSGIADASSVRLTHATNVVDALCFYYNASTLADFQNGVGFTCEGAPILNPAGTNNVDQSMERQPGGALGNATDTDDNPSNFVAITPAFPQSTASPPTP